MKKFRVQSINRHRMYIDGKGINTLVALYGCPLRCRYCLNKKVLATFKYKEITPEELLDKVIIDYCYFKATGGGITFGGGESLLHSSQIKAFSEVLPNDIPIKVETSLNVHSERLLEVLDIFDYVIRNEEEQKLSKELLKGTAVAASAAVLLTSCSVGPYVTEGAINEMPWLNDKVPY